MKRHNGAWLPDDERDAAMLFSGIEYQANKFDAAMAYINHKQMRRAVDIGAHCGLWTVQLGRWFSEVEAFEPLERHIECWRKNAGWKLSHHLHAEALGEESGTCGMHLVEQFSGRSHINGEGVYPMKRLDDYGFTDVDFLKADVEGYEYYALKGGERTLLASKPVMVIEAKGHDNGLGLEPMAAIRYLEGLGAEVREVILGDYIMTWKAAS